MTITTTQNRPGGGDYLFEAGFDADFDAPAPAPIDSAAITQRAHIANGGEGTETFTCPACRGRGRFISYAGRDVGPCFKCKGTAKISKGQNAAIKGKATKEANRIKWAEDHADEIAYITKRANKGSTFYASFIDKLREYGSLTENQMAIVAKDRAKDAEFWAAKKAEQAEKAGAVGVDKIDALFATAAANGLKRPIFRTERLTIKRAPATGRNPNALYVTDRDLGGEYVGKIVNGKFEARREAKPDTLKLLCEIADNPKEAAVKYGRSTGNCCICGRELTDPVSVANGIGPYCAEGFGF
jgi:hypothetical protein